MNKKQRAFLLKRLVQLWPLDLGKGRIANQLATLMRSWPSDVRAVHRRGLIFDVDLNDPMSRELFLLGYYERDVTWVLERALRPGDIFVDVGASFGFHTVVAADLVGPSGEVHCFEPHPQVFGVLYTISI